MLEDHASAVAGLGVEPLDGLRVTLEYFYNGANHGDRSASWLFRNLCSRSMHSAANMLGLDLSWTFAPGWHAGLLSLAAPGERAVWFQPSIAVRASEGLSLRAGAMLNGGGRPRFLAVAGSGFDPGSKAQVSTVADTSLGTPPSMFFIELVLSSD